MLGEYAIFYYTGLFVGLFTWMFYLYWVKHSGNPTIVFDKKYLVPLIMSILIAAIQLALELMVTLPVINFETAQAAFIAGFAIYVAIQEIWKGILKNPKIDYFNR